MKKKWIMIAGILISIVALAAVGTICFLEKGMNYAYTEGYCLVADNGSYLLITQASAIVMSDQSKAGDLFEDITTGDRIKVRHDGILETYPARTGVYKVEKLEEGTMDNLPKDVLKSLSELGWITLEDAP